MDLRLDSIKPGFSLIEILVAMMIIALMATLGPRLMRFNYDVEQKLVAQLNELMRNAQVHALIGGKNTQLFFDFTQTPARMQVRQITDKTEGGKPVYQPIKSPYGNDTADWDSHFEIEKFIINGKDEASGGVLKTIWVYVAPDGLSQQALLVLRHKDTGRRVELQLNPFFAQFAEVK